MGSVPSGKTLQGELETISGRSECASTTVTSRSSLQEYLIGKANAIPYNGSCSVCFYANFSGDSAVVNGNYYAGTLYKVDGTNYFVCKCSSLTANPLMIGRVNSSWYYEKK